METETSLDRVPDGLDDLLRRKRERGIAPPPIEPDPWATVTVVREDRPDWLGTSSGVVVIDRKRGGVLVGGQPRSFRVRAGEHLIGVRTGLEVVELGPMTLAAGDRLDLVCGREEPRGPSPARPGWGAGLRWHLERFGFGLGAALAAQVGYYAFPFLLTPIVVRLFELSLPLRWVGPLVWVTNLATSRGAGVVFGVAAWTLLTAPASGRRPRGLLYLRTKDGPPAPAGSIAEDDHG